MDTNIVYTGDCIDIMKTFIPDKSIDMVITSPPYDDLRDYNGYVFSYEDTLKEIYRVLKDGRVLVWIVSDKTVNGSETGTSFKQALHAIECGFNLHDTMIWKKPTFTNVGALKVRYGDVFDYMFVLSKGKVKVFNPIKDRKNIHAGTKMHGTMRVSDGTTKPVSGGNKKIFSMYGQRFNIWDCNNSGVRGKVHPATFPLQLAIDHIISWSNESELILDPMCGEGTSCIAAKKEGRQYIGIDISKTYTDIAIKNLNNTNMKTGGKANG